MRGPYRRLAVEDGSKEKLSAQPAGSNNISVLPDDASRRSRGGLELFGSFCRYVNDLVGKLSLLTTGHTATTTTERQIPTLSPQIDAAPSLTPASKQSGKRVAGTSGAPCLEQCFGFHAAVQLLVTASRDTGRN